MTGIAAVAISVTVGIVTTHVFEVGFLKILMTLFFVYYFVSTKKLISRKYLLNLINLQLKSLKIKNFLGSFRGSFSCMRELTCSFLR